ncbi:hypothetical protein [Streptomyces sp. NPDC006784]|uniref:hypothetical protein n=1 Tax=Streptomyces sp. NPDC006784 TaxID=3364764 RepID=UPI0036D03C3D
MREAEPAGDVSADHPASSAKDVEVVTAAAVEEGATVTFHSLVMRSDDDDPYSVVIGRPATGEFLELPTAYGTLLDLLRDGMTIGAAQERLLACEGIEVEAGEFVDLLIEEGFVRAVGSRSVADPADGAPPPHLPRVTSRHVGWVFSTPMKALWILLVCCAVATAVAQPGVVPRGADFFWTDYTGFAVLVNTVLFSASLSVHELMHLAAARSLGCPGRIGFGTRLHNLVLQTDVTAVWGLPRRRRYRVYLAGLVWDLGLLCVLILVLAHTPVNGVPRALLQSLALAVLLCIPLQLQVYTRTDLYYVLRDLLRCRNLFDDGIAWSRHLAARLASQLRRRPDKPADPTAELAPQHRRATRVYACFLTAGTALALSVAVFYGLPIALGVLFEALSAMRAGLSGGPVLRAVDAGVLILVEGGIQVMFVITFVRGHPHWFRSRRRVAVRKEAQAAAPASDGRRSSEPV